MPSDRNSNRPRATVEESIAASRPIDDALFQAICDQYPEIIQEFLSVFLNFQWKIIESNVQESHRPFGDKEYRFDVTAKAEDQSRVILEAQRERKLFPPGRAECYRAIGILQAHKSAGKYNKMKPCILVVICEDDITGEGKFHCVVRTAFEHNNAPYGKGYEAHFFCLKNAKPEDPGYELAMDFLESDPAKMRNSLLRQRVYAIKYTQKGLRDMENKHLIYIEQERADAWEGGKEEGREEGRAEGRREGKEEGRAELAISMVADGTISVESAAKHLDLSLEEVALLIEKSKKQQ